MRPSVIAFRDELEKIAATRYVKELRRLAQGGDFAAVEQMAAKLHKGKVWGKGSEMGKPIMSLGTGAESPMVDLTVGAMDAPAGLSVRKIYDAGGDFFLPNIIKRKVQVGKQLRNDPLFAKMYSDELRHVGANPYHHMEYIPGRAAKEVRTSKVWEKGKDIREGLARAESRTGYVPEDVLKNTYLGYHPENLRFTPGTTWGEPGAPKIIDMLPTTRGELQRAAKASDAVRMRGGSEPEAMAAYWKQRGTVRDVDISSPRKALTEAGRARVQEALRGLPTQARQAPKVRGAMSAPEEWAYANQLFLRRHRLPEAERLALRERAAQRVQDARARKASAGKQTSVWSSLVDFIRTAPGRALHAIQRVFGWTPEQARNFAEAVV